MKRGGFGVALAVVALSLLVPSVSEASCGTPTYFYPPDFGSQAVGTVGPTFGAAYPVDQFYGLGLGGSDPTVVTSVNVTVTGNNPADWLVVQNQCDGTLPAGAGCGFDLSFAPTAPGPRSATVTLYANGCPIFVWPVTGTGVVPATPTAPGQPGNTARPNPPPLAFYFSFRALFSDITGVEEFWQLWVVVKNQSNQVLPNAHFAADWGSEEAAWVDNFGTPIKVTILPAGSPFNAGARPMFSFPVVGRLFSPPEPVKIKAFWDGGYQEAEILVP
jgi:hypothetical protein